MAFFNTKEEVINIELTPYGKHLLSQGKFKPVYYEFYDDDIVYDSSYFGQTEKQSEIQERIKNTKRKKVQYTFEGAETRVKEYRRRLEKDRTISQDEFLEKRKSLYTNFLPLGKSSFDKNNNTSIQLKLLSGKIENVSSSVSIVGLPNNLNIIELAPSHYTLFYDFINTEKTQIAGEPTEVVSIEQQRDILEQFDIKTFSDNSFVNVLKNEIFIELFEENADDIVENFEISIFEIAEDGTEIPLFFEETQRPEIVKNNILLENEDYPEYLQKKEEDYFLQKHFVNQYLDIRVDKEIETAKFCEYLSKTQLQRLKMVEGYDITCDESQEIIDLLKETANTEDR